MQMEVEIRTTDVKERQKVLARTQEIRMVREQTAFARMHDRSGNLQPFASPFMVLLAPGQEAYQPGRYMLKECSIYINRYSQLEINPVLVPIQVQELQAA